MPLDGMEKQQQRRRRRPALSCRECRRRKIRCDRNDPCNHCVRHKAQCTYKLYGDVGDDRPEPDRSVSPGQQPSPSQAELQGHQLDGDNEAHVGSATARASSVCNPLSAHNQQRQAPSLSPSHSHSVAHNQGPGPLYMRDRTASLSGSRRHVHRPSISHPDVDVGELLQRIKKLEGSVATSRASDSPTLQAASEPSPAGNLTRAPHDGQHDWQIVLNKSRDLGRSQLVGGAEQFASIITCYGEIIGKGKRHSSYQSPEGTALIAQATSFLGKCKQRARSLKLGRPSRCPPASDVSIAPVSRDMAQVMASLYFGSFESSHRILHSVSFWATFRRYWDTPESISPSHRFQVLLVIGIGSSLYDHGDADSMLRNQALVHQWIYAAQTWLSGPLEKDRLDLAGLQVYCLTILARQIFSIGGDTVWLSMGSLIHRAMQLGLHRDPKHLPVMSVLQAEVRRRLWATILDMAVQSALDSWMPPRIRLDEFDTEPPSNLNDDELDESTTVIQAPSKTTFTSTSCQLALLDSLPTRLRIVQLLNGLHAESSYAQVLSLSSDLTQALCTSSKLVEHDLGNGSVGSTAFRRNMLSYLIHRFMIPLHLYFSNQARANPLFQYSLKVSLDTALAILSPEQDDAFSRLMNTGGGLFREGLRSAITAVSLELLAHVEGQRTDGTMRRAPQYRNLLKKVVRDLASTSEERIRLGETNVKSHMFLSMILAQVEAAEQGLPVELEIARGAKDSLELCYNLLSNRPDVWPSLTSPADAGLASALEEMDAGAQGFGEFGLNLDWETFSVDNDFPNWEHAF